MGQRRPLIQTIPLLLLALALSAASAGAALGKPAETGLNQQLAQVRQATARYHDVSAAIADGYVPTDHCLAVPELGTMGYHYVNPQLASDATLDPLQPEVLLYVPSGDGVKLVAVEYFIAAAATTGTPFLFGQPFDGPMPGHEPGMPEHYDLHAWLWAPNPGGVFAQFNPSVDCGA